MDGEVGMLDSGVRGTEGGGCVSGRSLQGGRFVATVGVGMISPFAFEKASAEKGAPLAEISEIIFFPRTAQASTGKTTTLRI